MNKLVIVVLVVALAAINALYDGKIAEFIGTVLHEWQTGESPEDRFAREQHRTILETRYHGVEACLALKDLAREVGAESVERRGIWAEVLLENVKKDSDRKLVTEYLDAFENLAYEEGREFDRALRRIVGKYCSRS